MLLLDDKPHLRQRKLMLPAFHGDRLAAIRELMGEISREEIAGWHDPGTVGVIWAALQAAVVAGFAALQVAGWQRAR